MGCDDISIEFRRIAEVEREGARVLEEKGVGKFIVYAAEHYHDLHFNKSTAERTLLADRLTSMSPESMQPIGDEEIFSQADHMLQRIGISPEDERYAALMTGMVGELKGVDDTIKHAAEEMLGVAKVE